MINYFEAAEKTLRARGLLETALGNLERKKGKTGFIAITGKEKPEMENEITPHKEAKLNPRRSVGSVPILSLIHISVSRLAYL